VTAPTPERDTRAETPGQAAYEAHRRAEASQLQSPRAREMALAGKGWGTLTGDERAWWIAAADAALKAGTCPHGDLAAQAAKVARERDEAEDEVRELLRTWPRCPAGCNCRIGVADDPDRNECGCDGPCNGEPQPAPELAAAMAETRQLRELVSEIIGEFSPTGSGLYARVGQVQIGKWCKRAGMPK